jgi:hypothetical protein
VPNPQAKANLIVYSHFFMKIEGEEKFECMLQPHAGQLRHLKEVSGGNHRLEHIRLCTFRAMWP